MKATPRGLTALPAFPTWSGNHPVATWMRAIKSDPVSAAVIAA